MLKDEFLNAITVIKDPWQDWQKVLLLAMRVQDGLWKIKGE